MYQSNTNINISTALTWTQPFCPSQFQMSILEYTQCCLPVVYMYTYTLHTHTYNSHSCIHTYSYFSMILRRNPSANCHIVGVTLVCSLQYTPRTPALIVVTHIHLHTHCLPLSAHRVLCVRLKGSTIATGSADQTIRSVYTTYNWHLPFTCKQQ